MAEATLNFNEAALDKDSVLYGLYSRLYEGMRTANTVDSPSFVTDPPLTDEGEVDTATIDKKLAEYSDILMKNSAYLYANSIVSAISGGGGGGPSGGGLGYVSRSGDSMTGLLTALYGFQAGYSNTKIFEVSIDSDNKPVAYVYGRLSITGDEEITGKLTLGDSGLWFGATQFISMDGDHIKLSNENIDVNGKINLDGSLAVGDVLINENGIFWGDYEFYHKGNSNKEDVDWTMRDANVYGNLTVKGDFVSDGKLIANNGFIFRLLGRDLLYTDIFEEIGEDGEIKQTPFITLQTNIEVLSGYGLQFDKNHIIKTQGGKDGFVAFSAPGYVMRLGDSDNGAKTKHISLQSAIKNYNNTYTIVSQYGDGNFPNSFSAGSGNASDTEIYTYYDSSDDHGVAVTSLLRFENKLGPCLFAQNGELSGKGVWKLDGERNEVTWFMYFQSTTSPFSSTGEVKTPTLHFGTEAEMIAFDTPAEAPFFAIKSEQYKTRLIEDALFLNDNAFLEGLPDGIRHAGNSYFDKSLSSQRFASGFAGYGFGIMLDGTDYHATFDSLTIRKKLRAFEFEVQKISATNGSLWVSDSCSGDEVMQVE